MSDIHVEYQAIHVRGPQIKNLTKTKKHNTYMYPELLANSEQKKSNIQPKSLF